MSIDKGLVCENRLPVIGTVNPVSQVQVWIKINLQLSLSRPTVSRDSRWCQIRPSWHVNTINDFSVLNVFQERHEYEKLFLSSSLKHVIQNIKLSLLLSLSLQIYRLNMFCISLFLVIYLIQMRYRITMKMCFSYYSCFNFFSFHQGSSERSHSYMLMNKTMKPFFH